MWFSLADQTVYFLASIAMGAALAAVYDVLRALRMLMRAGRAAVLVTDILFFAFCGVATSLFALPFNKGNVRAFIVFGEAAGFLAYRLTLGSIFGKIYAAAAGFLRHIIRKICEILKKFYDFLLKAAGIMLYNILEVEEGFFRTLFSGLKQLASERRASVPTRRRKVKNKHEQRTEDRRGRSCIPRI